MTIDDAITNMDNFLAALEAEMPAVADEVALNALALVKNRIVDKGEGIEGAAYSTRPMLATEEKFVVKSAFKQSKVQVKRKDGTVVNRKLWIRFPRASKAVPVMELPDGYKQFREIQGREGDHVNLSYTGHMWQATTIVARTHTGLTWVTIIGGLDEEAKNKLSWMTEKYGEFLKVMPEEQILLDQIFHTRLQSIYDRVFHS